jgi:hypothetical protein
MLEPHTKFKNSGVVESNEEELKSCQRGFDPHSEHQFELIVNSSAREHGYRSGYP